MVFRTDRKTSTEPDETFKGSLLSFDELYKWAQEKCIPLVREITFENAEELTEEGLPFLILFHHPTDTESVKQYKEVIMRELEGEKRKFIYHNNIIYFQIDLQSRKLFCNQNQNWNWFAIKKIVGKSPKTGSLQCYMCKVLMGIIFVQ